MFKSKWLRRIAVLLAVVMVLGSVPVFAEGVVDDFVTINDLEEIVESEEDLDDEDVELRDLEEDKDQEEIIDPDEGSEENSDSNGKNTDGDSDLQDGEEKPDQEEDSDENDEDDTDELDENSDEEELSDLEIEELDFEFEDALLLDGWIWDGSIASEFAGGTGTSTDPYRIETAAQLAYLGTRNSSNTSNNHYLLKADIDLNHMNWYPIQNFNGIFDGDDHTIYNLYINSSGSKVGLFGSVGSAGEIRNINIVDSYVSGRGNVGSIVGYMSGLVIENCTSSGDVYNTGEYTGGIVGYMYSGEINNCINTGNISGAQHTGGIAGRIQLTGTIRQSTNKGNIEGTREVGGIVGGIRNIIDCVNLGAVSGTGIYVGGVVGYITVLVDNNRNAGTVSGFNFTGGVAGYNGGVTQASVNEGSVTGASYVGGVAGDSVSVINCRNDASIESEDTCIGGVVGRSTSTIDCDNAGSVCGGIYTGGIIGYSRGSQIENCNNSGVVRSNKEYTGGIAGYMSAGEIIGCTNETDIFGAQHTGGIAGRIASAGTVSNSRNYGQVTGTREVGGIIGGTRHTLNCLNTGTVSGTDIYVGGVVGYATQLVENNVNEGNVSGAQSVGGVAGSAGTVVSCSNAGKVIGTQNLGGIAGTADSVRDSVNNFEVSGTNNVGGIVGSGNSTYDCANYAMVEGAGNVGGIIGFGKTGSAEKCFNYGSVAGTGTYVGGIVGWYSTATVKDCINDAEVTGGDFTAGIAGCLNTGRLDNTHNYGKISNEGTYIGGIVGGINSNGTVNESINYGDIEGIGNYVGGIAGGMRYITSCANYGNVLGTGQYTGGIVGYVTMLVDNSYNMGKVTGNNSTGGLAGYNGRDTIRGYNVGEVSGNSTTTDGIVGSGTRSNTCYILKSVGTEDSDLRVKTSAELKRQSTFEGWDFENVWSIEEGVSYPKLQWVEDAPGNNELPDNDSLIWPTESGEVTLWFGQNNIRYPDFHRGMNIQGKAFDEVVSIGDGELVYVGYLNGFGYVAFVNCLYEGRSIQIRYGHLAEQPDLQIGQIINKGDVVGRMGTHLETGKGLLEIVTLESLDGKACEIDESNGEYIDPHSLVQRPEMETWRRLYYLSKPFATILDEGGLSLTTISAASASLTDSVDDENHRYRANLDINTSTPNAISPRTVDEEDAFRMAYEALESGEKYLRRYICDELRDIHPTIQPIELGTYGYLTYDLATDTATLNFKGRVHQYSPRLGNAVYKNGELVVQHRDLWANHYQNTYYAPRGGMWEASGTIDNILSTWPLYKLYLPKDIALQVKDIIYAETPDSILWDIIQTVIGTFDSGLDSHSYTTYSQSTTQFIAYIAQKYALDIAVGEAMIYITALSSMRSIVGKIDKSAFEQALNECTSKEFFVITESLRPQVHPHIGLYRVNYKTYSVETEIKDPYPIVGTFTAGEYLYVKKTADPGIFYVRPNDGTISGIGTPNAKVVVTVPYQEGVLVTYVNDKHEWSVDVKGTLREGDVVSALQMIPGQIESNDVYRTVTANP